MSWLAWSMLLVAAYLHVIALLYASVARAAAESLVARITGDDEEADVWGERALHRHAVARRWDLFRGER